MNGSNFTLKPNVVLSHSGVQYAYPIAAALQNQGLLKAFWTTVFLRSRRSRVSMLERILRRSAPRDLKSELVHSFPWPELCQRALISTLGKNDFTQNQMLVWRNRWFDRYVARRSDTDFDSFIGFSGSCIFSLKAAKLLDKHAIVNQHDVHHRFAFKILEEEASLHPDFNLLNSFWPPHQGYLDQLEEELALADHILVPSQFGLETHRSEGISEDRLVSIPLGISLPDEMRISKARPRKPFRILFVGTISQRKGIQYLLEAVKQLRLPECELILLGSIGGDPAPLKQYATVFRHGGFVSRQKLEAYWATSHVLVLPSLYDALGQVIPEAMSWGVPVLISENTAGKEFVRDGIDGFIVPIRDVEAMKDRLLKLHGDQDLWQAMSENARQRASQFTWARYERHLSNFLRTGQATEPSDLKSGVVT
jgi:alpha-maltose-1-phosphate synthase